MMPDYSPLWHWIRNRETARIAKDRGDSHPYVDDQIISTYRFCNVRREDDRGTVWIRENIRKPYADHPYLWFMLCIARQINWPDTLHDLESTQAAWPDHEHFSPEAMTHVLNARKAAGQKIYTGAYMISAPSTKGDDKQAFIAEKVCGGLWWRRQEIAKYLNEEPSLQGTHRLLKDTSGWGDFMAYQAVVDMRFTGLLRNAPDIEKWAAAGPGTIRGLNRVHGRRLTFNLHQSRALAEMRRIWEAAPDNTDVKFDFSDVPNILCETDKYLRVKNGEGKPRAKYVPGRGY